MKKYIPIITKSLVIILGIIGLVFTFGAGDFMSSNAILYFTVQSNLWIMAICAVFLIYNIIEVVKNKKIVIPKWLKIIKFIFTVAISLTFLVFTFILTPSFIIQGNLAYLFTIGNICVHNLVPILAILDWCLFDHDFKTNKWTFLYGAIMPLYYLVFAMIGSVSGFDFGGGSRFPYFFFDYVQNTWFSIGNGKMGTFYWIIVLILLVLAIGRILILVKNKISKKIESKQKI